MRPKKPPVSTSALVWTLRFPAAVDPAQARALLGDRVELATAGAVCTAVVRVPLSGVAADVAALRKAHAGVRRVAAAVAALEVHEAPTDVVLNAAEIAQGLAGLLAADGCVAAPPAFFLNLASLRSEQLANRARRDVARARDAVAAVLADDEALAIALQPLTPSTEVLEELFDLIRQSPASAEAARVVIRWAGRSAVEAHVARMRSLTGLQARLHLELIDAALSSPA